MHEISFNADRLISALLNLPPAYGLCLLDSAGASNLGSHLLIAGFLPLEVLEINEPNAEKSLEILSQKLSQKNTAAILSVGYEFGLKLNHLAPRSKESNSISEPNIFLSLFDFLVVHDYRTGKTFLTGNESRFPEAKQILEDSAQQDFVLPDGSPLNTPTISSNFTREQYIGAIKEIQENIRDGFTYQTNLTQQLRATLPADLTPEKIFFNLRRHHPAAFSAFLRRPKDAVVSVSPERFFQVESEKWKVQSLTDDEEERQSSKVEDRRTLTNTQNDSFSARTISVSPIKGTRRRGVNPAEDLKLKNELLASEKDLAENVMIVDLLRNDIGRICDYGTVAVEKLYDLETYPTLFHLVSTVNGRLRENVTLADILKALFPCGSITGAPKIRTMQIIDELETAPRGLSMGALGYVNFDGTMDFSVAIRTMTIRDQTAVFNVGGGIVIDSVPEDEYAETLIKAQALLQALGIKISPENFHF